MFYKLVYRSLKDPTKYMPYRIGPELIRPKWGTKDNGKSFYKLEDGELLFYEFGKVYEAKRLERLKYVPAWKDKSYGFWGAENFFDIIDMFIPKAIPYKKGNGALDYIFTGAEADLWWNPKGPDPEKRGPWFILKDWEAHIVCCIGDRMKLEPGTPFEGNPFKNQSIVEDIGSVFKVLLEEDKQRVLRGEEGIFSLRTRLAMDQNLWAVRKKPEFVERVKNNPEEYYIPDYSWLYEEKKLA